MGLLSRGMRKWGIGILIFLCLLSLAASSDKTPEQEEEEEYKANIKEFKENCQLQRNLSKEPFNIEYQCAATDEFDVLNLRMILSLVLILLVGTFVRTMLKIFNISFPYTVILMMLGLLIGTISKFFCNEMYTFTAIARMPPSIILYIFLPVLIFESAFNISVHTFMRSVSQILVLALPGMVLVTMITATFCYLTFKGYEWGFVEAALFGSIISATDPVAVVAILRELGTSEMLGVLIEGESLLNDGVAILLYEIFKMILEGKVQSDALFETVILKFLQIAIGGCAFGWVMGKISVICLAFIFNDAIVEITITFVAAYLTYFIGENFLQVSGVMAVVLLGLTMASEKTSISPEVEELVHHFWEMLGYLANTVLFVLVGIVITETALANIDAMDIWYLAILYVVLCVFRFGMLLLAFPLLQRLGYGCSWENMIIIMWGGLRGAVGICLALEVYENKHFCHMKYIGPKFLFLTAGIVFLTLLVNGTTTKKLLELLKLTEISPGRILDMANAVKKLNEAQGRTFTLLKHDRFLADANWTIVEKYTNIKNPYEKKHLVKIEAEKKSSILSIHENNKLHYTECKDCHAKVKNEPTEEEYREMTDEARIRVLKALRVSFWRQYEKGVLSEVSTQILVNACEKAEDKEFYLVHAKDLKKNWSVKGFFPWFRKKIIWVVGTNDDLPAKPENSIRGFCWWFVTRFWFEPFILFVVCANIAFVIWEFHDNLAYDEDKIPQAHVSAFRYNSVIFCAFYILEFVVKNLGLGIKEYWKQKLNWIDFALIIIGIGDIIIDFEDFKSLGNFTGFFRFLKLIRIIRLFRLLRPGLPRILGWVDGRINARLFLGYDVGKGFVAAIDETVKFLPNMADHPRIVARLKSSLDNEKLETVREMGLLQKDHPDIAIAVKTRHANRAVLNNMRECLEELKDDGLLDEKEAIHLLIIIESKMKRLWNSPASVIPTPPESLLHNISWVMGNAEIHQYVVSNSTLINYAFGDVILKKGDPANGVYIIVSGMVKIHYEPTDAAINDVEQYGILPNTEIFSDLSFSSKEEDFFSTGTVIGELGCLTKRPCFDTVTCETCVLAYHINQVKMDEAIEKFDEKNDTLESRIWRSVGMKISLVVLPIEPLFQTWSVDKVRVHIERSSVPIGVKYLSMDIPDFVADIIVIQGKVMDAHTKITYTAPCYIPRSVNKLAMANGKVDARILVVAYEDMPTFLAPNKESQASLFKCLNLASKMRKGVHSEERMGSKKPRYSVAVNYGVRSSKREPSNGRKQNPQEGDAEKKQGPESSPNNGGSSE